MIENCETELKSYQEWNLDEIKKLNLFDDVKFLNKDNNQPNIYCSNKNYLIMRLFSTVIVM